MKQNNHILRKIGLVMGGILFILTSFVFQSFSKTNNSLNTKYQSINKTNKLNSSVEELANIAFKMENNELIDSTSEMGVFSTFQKQTQICDKIYFESGWNLFSSPVNLDSADMKLNFKSLIENGSLIKIQDEEGWSLENIGIFGGWTNNIGIIDPSEGYKIKLTQTDSVEFCGTAVNYPYPIVLNTGWNIMGYPSVDTINAMDVIEQLIENETLIKVQNEKGQSLEDLGDFGGWQNFIGNMDPGEAYKIKMTAPDTLWIYESYADTISDLPKIPGGGFIKSVNILALRSSQEIFTKSINKSSYTTKTKHFKTVYQGNGVDHMNFNLIRFSQNLFDSDDEIAVFDGNSCVGAIQINDRHLETQLLSITASSKDDMGMEGFTVGNKYNIRLWDSGTNKESELSFKYLSGPVLFTKHESVVLSLENKSTVAIQGYDEE
ncbi:MAG: hypothetical protein JXR36_03845, partial [Bacteroidales bacterium]|nr:hypothetical protein [Bacteroidales bacterium]